MNKICKNIFTSTVAVTVFFILFLGAISTDSTLGFDIKKGFIAGFVVVVLMFLAAVAVCRLKKADMKPADIEGATSLPSWRSLSQKNKTALTALFILLILLYIFMLVSG